MRVMWVRMWVRRRAPNFGHSFPCGMADDTSAIARLLGPPRRALPCAFMFAG